jgi:signal transduction histidine kinase
VNAVTTPRDVLSHRLRVILATAAVTLLLVWAAGTAARALVLGSNVAAARRNVEHAVRASVDAEISAAAQHATAVDAMVTAGPAFDDDPQSVRRLFDALAARVRDDAGTQATTILDADAAPVAWAGRPSDIPVERVRRATADWFVLEWALGLRLVHVRPLTNRPGMVLVTERNLGSAAASTLLTSLQSPGTSRYRLETRWVSVSLEVPSANGRTSEEASRVDIDGPTGRPLVTAILDPDDLARAFTEWAAAVRSALCAVLALTALVCAGAILDWRSLTRASRPLSVAAGVIACLWMARIALLVEPASGWAAWPAVTAVTYASPTLPRLLASPFDFAATALCATGSVLALVHWSETIGLRRGRDRGARTRSWLVLALRTAAAGVAVVAVLEIYVAFLQDTVAHATVDLLHLSLAPFSAPRLLLQLGLVVAHTGLVAALVLVLRASAWWRRRAWGVGAALAPTCWIQPAGVWVALRGDPAAPAFAAAPLALAVLLALGAPWVWRRYRRGSQAFRLVVLALCLIVPALTFYPTVFELSRQAKLDLVETRYAPQALSQRRTVYALLEKSLGEIDVFPELAGLVGTPREAGSSIDTGPAFQVWQATALARYPVTSSVEVYGRDGALLSRFAFNLPEDLSAAPRSDERSCDWTVAEEVAPFFAEERRIYHAGRAICGADGTVIGSLVVHAMLDYENLPFTAARTPYVALMQPGDAGRADSPDDEIQYAVYGWSRTPLYSSNETAWPLDDAVFALLEGSRDPVWARLRRNGEPFRVYLQNDRGGIYALGFPDVTAFGHLVNLAELITLGTLAFLCVAIGAALFRFGARRVVPAETLLREVRGSFYRKLFLAFVAAVVVPVALLALVARSFVAAEMRTGVEREALRTSGAASRVVADLIAPQAAQQGSSLDDNLMVWVSRLINEDANIFAGTTLQATSERTVFASGLLPSRTPAEVYRSILLQREAGAVARERIGDFEYVVAAAPIRLGSVDAVMTVPLTSRQRDIDQQIDALDRRVLLAALVFILAGAALGYTMAERIADPVSRLTRATRRIAGGDFDIRIASASSDEFARLVADFNKMASELQRQRAQLQHTHRIEAWAEMARQVAHDIKNPLTPIQLNAEHLRRVHADRGEPLGPVVRDCVDTILAQVTLLRQISSEFSNFASSPSVKRTVVDSRELVAELVAPYSRGLSKLVTVTVHVDDNLPPVFIDRALVLRSLTNIIENALHAMSGITGGGALTVTAAVREGMVAIEIADTGAGMDEAALQRAFEPYFSTKARGTGLGLPIAKRNIELSGGTIGITSQRDQGTRVEVRLPVAREP